MSGEIDIVESRGNSPKNYSGGRDTATSALHWGLDFNTDRFLQTNNKRYLRRTDYSKDFHTFGLEWSSNYLYTYIDNRLLQVLSVGFGGKNMWVRSGLAKTYPSVPKSLLCQTKQLLRDLIVIETLGLRQAEPTLHLTKLSILSSMSQLAGLADTFCNALLLLFLTNTDFYYRDSVGGKPWIDWGSATAARDFWKANQTWRPTWVTGDSKGMTVKSAKMWQEGVCP
jgi:hypothetical protein